MELLAAWALYPVALGAICLGLGLLVARAAAWDRELHGALLAPAGFATLLVLAQALTARGDTAKLALPVIAVLTVAGLVLGRRRLRALRPERWLVLGAVVVAAVFAAPVVATGTPTLAGYLALPDTGHQLALAEMYAERGPQWYALPEGGSTKKGVTPYVISGYPVAAQAALGVTEPLGVLDLAWLYQPWLTFSALMLFLALAALVARLFEQRWRTALVATVAAMPALVVSYAMQGSIKEMAAVAVVVTTIALVAAAIAGRRPARSLLVPALVAPALLGAIGAAALAYLALPGLALLGFAGARMVRERRPGDLAWVGAAAVLAIAAALPVLQTLENQIYVVDGTLGEAPQAASGAAPPAQLGNLAQPLVPAQSLGVWFAGDYRYRTLEAGTAQDVALWIAGALAVLGLAWAIRRRRWEPLALFAGLALPTGVLLARGSAYADAKVLMLVSPAVVLLAAVGAACLWRGRWRAPSLVAMAAAAGAVVWSAGLVYHDASLAPYARYEEMIEASERMPPLAPVLLNEYDEFAKYFLARQTALNEPETNHRFRRAPYEPDALEDRRRRPSVKSPLDMDDLQLRYVESIPYLLLRRSPTASRPPASFTRIWSGEHYDLWQRTAGVRVLAHSPLGRSVLVPAAPVSREQARAWGRRAQRLGGRIAYVQREPLAMFLVSHHPRPQRWGGFGDYPEGIVTDGPGRIEAPVRVRRTGRYHVWLEGSFARALKLRIDGRDVGRTPNGLNNPGAYVSLGTVALERGDRGVQLVQGGGDLRPGNGGYRSSHRHLGPMVFDPVGNEAARVREIAARDWRELVGVRADWLEVVAR